MATLRLSRAALASLRASLSHCRSPPLFQAAEMFSSHCRSREIPTTASSSWLARSSHFNDVGLAQGLARSSSATATSGLINNSEFTEMAWEGVVGAVDAAQGSRQQVVETEHIVKALLEQKEGLAHRIFTKAELDNTSVLQATEEFISQQPKVMEDTSGPILGSNLSSVLDAARKHKKEMGDSFVSVEHLLLAFLSDKRFGQQLFMNLQLSENALKDAIQSVRGSQRVTDQTIDLVDEAAAKLKMEITSKPTELDEIDRRPPPPTFYPSAQKQNRQTTQFELGKNEKQLTEQRGLLEDSDFLENFMLGFYRESKREGKNPIPDKSTNYSKSGGGGKQDETANAAVPPPPQPEDADEIFKKMKETGLIPNAVAMLDGLCKNGLVQEAMKLFGLMRETGTIPEVIIYTAVVKGFSKAQKLDDAISIFRKMQSNGVNPNAFSYGVLIQGLCRGKRLDDAAVFCVEMLDAGHSPNVASFTGLVDGFCREKGLEEARSMINSLRQKSFCLNEKTVKEYLEKKGPFLPLVWEAILGENASQRSSFSS